MEQTSRPRRKDGVLTQNVSGTLILLDSDGGTYYSLDEIGEFIWNLCDGTRGVDAIVAVVCDAYAAPSEAIRADVVELLDDLSKEHMVVVGE